VHVTPHRPLERGRQNYIRDVVDVPKLMPWYVALFCRRRGCRKPDRPAVVAGLALQHPDRRPG